MAAGVLLVSGGAEGRLVLLVCSWLQSDVVVHTKAQLSKKQSGAYVVLTAGGLYLDLSGSSPV